MTIIFKKIYFKELINFKIDKPTGQLSGHNAGEPFSETIYNFLKKKQNNKIFKQYEYLNKILLENNALERNELFKDSLGSIISRGINQTKEWTKTKLFEEKQNDTADIIFTDNKLRAILDVKTKNLSKKSQPPNIISAYKLAKFSENLIRKNDSENIEINYISIAWIEEENKLIIKNIEVIDLFKISPDKIYINWAAAMQIQFDPQDVDQSYSNNKIEWAYDFIKNYIESAKEREKTMRVKFIDPFMSLIDN